MGMFDYVNYECVCPICHHKVDEFQTKDGTPALQTVNPEDVDYFYNTCPFCGVWIEFTRNNGKLDGRVYGKDRKLLKRIKYRK